MFDERGTESDKRVKERRKIAPILWDPSKAGLTWESQLIDLHGLYLKTRQAAMHKTYPEVQVLKGGRRARVTGKAPPDFFGCTSDLALLGEAKTSQENTWPMNMLQKHQAERMSEWEDIGPRNVSCIFLLMREHDVRYILPWEDLRDRWYRWLNHDKGTRTNPAAKGTASLTIEQLDRIGIRFDASGWLAPLQAWAKNR